MKQWRQDELDFFPFENDRDRLNSNLLLTSGGIKNQLMLMLAPFDLTLTQYQALQVLNLQQGKAISTLHLRERMLDKMSDTPKIVERLIKKGLVVKEISLKDRRLVDIYITEAGQRVLAEIQSSLQTARQTSSSLTGKEVTTLNYLLSKLRLGPVKKRNI
ncbi:MAG: MarR family winged helix-turn-helix transcriptional regulator [Bacteroidetes bacterium]|nr:MarR family winged helix-turn-helix transcriptional regulator [Bacteroidota bacterium]